MFLVKEEAEISDKKYLQSSEKSRFFSPPCVSPTTDRRAVKISEHKKRRMSRRMSGLWETGHCFLPYIGGRGGDFNARAVNFIGEKEEEGETTDDDDNF